MEEKIIKIIEKIRKAFSFSDKYKSILNNNPEITIYYENNKFVIHSISFSDGKKSIILEDNIVTYYSGYSIGEYMILGKIEIN